MARPITTLLGYIEVIEEKANNSMASDVRMHAMWGCNVSELYVCSNVRTAKECFPIIRFRTCPLTTSTSPLPERRPLARPRAEGSPLAGPRAEGRPLPRPGAEGRPFAQVRDLPGQGRRVIIGALPRLQGVVGIALWDEVDFDLIPLKLFKNAFSIANCTLSYGTLQRGAFDSAIRDHP